MNAPAPISSGRIDVPPNVQPYVAALGAETAAKFLLAFGGSVVYLAERPQARSKLAKVLTAEQIRELAHAVAGQRWVRVPTAKPYLACYLRAAGMPVAEICTTLHVADSSVRRWTAKDPECKPAPRPPQLHLFD